MAKDFQDGARKIFDSDTARAIAATAVGEAIRRVGTTRAQASERASNLGASVAAGFAVGAGTATIAQVAAKRVGRLITRRRRSRIIAPSAAKVASGARKTVRAPRDAVENFTSK